MRSTRKPLLAVALFATAFAVPALAQPGSGSGYPTACEASKVSKGDVERAHTVYLSGKGFLDEASYDKAISYFKDAYSIDCSVHAILPIIATAYERKGDKAAAVGALQEYLKRVPNAPDRESLERRIKNLQDQMPHDAPTAAPPATTGPAPTGTTPPPPAPTTAPSATPPAATTSTPPTTSTSQGGPGAAPWIVVGIGGAALVTGVILYGVGSGDVSSASDACPARTGCSQSVADQGNNGRKLETLGVVVGAVGLAAAAGGLLWYFLDSGSSGSPASALAPVIAPGYGGVALGGRF